MKTILKFILGCLINSMTLLYSELKFILNSILNTLWIIRNIIYLIKNRVYSGIILLPSIIWVLLFLLTSLTLTVLFFYFVARFLLFILQQKYDNFEQLDQIVQNYISEYIIVYLYLLGYFFLFCFLLTIGQDFLEGLLWINYTNLFQVLFFLWLITTIVYWVFNPDTEMGSNRNSKAIKKPVLSR